MKTGNYILLVISLLTLVFGFFLPAITNMKHGSIGLATGMDPSLASVTWKYSTTLNTIMADDPPITADIDGDDKLDSLFLGGMKNGTTDTGIILRINSYNGTEVWRREKAKRGYELNPLELYDINDDGVPELFSSWGDSKHSVDKGMICLNAVNGSTIWINWNAMPAWHHFVIIADKTTNVPYIYFNGHNSTMNKMYATNGTIAKTISSGLSCNGGLSAADMKNDGNVEIILSLHSPPGIVCYDTDLNKKWQANVDTNSSTQCGGLVDVTRDGVLDVVTLFQCDQNSHHAGLNVIDGATGQRVDNMSSYNLGLDAHSQGSIADLDNDGYYEITTGYGGFQKILRIKNPPEIIANLSSVLQPHAAPQFIDLVNDSYLEIIGVSEIVDGRTFQQISGLSIVQWRGMINDIDGDGLSELFGARNGRINVYDTDKVPVPGINTYTSDYGYRRLYSAIAYDPCPGTYWYSWDEWHKPTAYLITPKNQSSNISQLPLVTIYANDSDGDNLNVYWYENTSGTWVLQQINSSVPANSKVSWLYINANVSQNKYWWKVTVNDGTNTVSSWFYFTTKANMPPYTPSNPSPANGATGVSVNADLSWTGGDPDPGDTVTYNVYFGTTNPPPKVSTNQSTTTYDPGTLNQLTTYYWKIKAWDNHGASTIGPVWVFTTQSTTNHPPNQPKKPTGPTTRLIGQQGTYWANGTDPDSDKIQYRFDWNASGSHTYSGWTSLVNSGQKLSKNHSWTKAGTYVVKVQSRDEHGALSVWSNGLTVTVTVNHPPNQPKKPTGPTTRLIGQQGTYWANGTDPDGDKIQYRFDWDAAGSHSYSAWTSLVNSGTKLSKTHAWSTPGTYVVKVQARDEHGVKSVWSNGLTVIVHT